METRISFLATLTALLSCATTDIEPAKQTTETYDKRLDLVRVCFDLDRDGYYGIDPYFVPYAALEDDSSVDFIFPHLVGCNICNDCDDNDQKVKPAAIEAIDELDNNCDGHVDEATNRTDVNNKTAMDTSWNQESTLPQESGLVRRGF